VWTLAQRQRKAAEGDDGVALILFAICMSLFIVLAALAVDVGSMVQEKRSLQSSADAAALAVADDCLGGVSGACSSGSGSTATAKKYANANSDDGCTKAKSVVFDPGSNATSGGVKVTTETASGTTCGAAEQKHWFAPGSFTSHATAKVIWGGPGGLTSALPMTISVCEWQNYTNGGTVYTPPNTLHSPWPNGERVVYLRGPIAPCGTDKGEVPGGFGWLTPEAGCRTPSSTTGWYDGDNGISPPSSCSPTEMKTMVGKTVFVPIFDEAVGNGSDAEYHIKGYAAFFLTGIATGGQYDAKSLVTNKAPCKGEDRCISGYFTTGTLSTGVTGGGADMGTSSIRFTE